MIRMNYFQRLIRHWDRIHPYNAAQVMRLSIPCDLEGAQEAWDSTLRDLGLGSVEIRGSQYRHLPGQSEVFLLEAGREVDAYISRQLNVCFEPDQCPFRPFIQSAGREIVAGIVYHHWVADSVSVRVLMREWFVRMAGCGERRREHLAMLPDDSASRSTESIRSAIRLLCAMKRTRRLPRKACLDLEVEHRLLHLPDDTAQALRDTGHMLGVKVSDLMLCTLTELCNKYLPAAHPHRPDLAIGCIRDTRTAADGNDAFGAALAFTPVLCPDALIGDRTALLTHIAKQTARHRQGGVGRAGASAAVGTRLAILALGLVRRRHVMEFIRKRMCFSAGLSNVDLTQTWVTQHRPVLAEYYRVSPTGPALPLVITPTTAGRQFNISLTWRKSAISATAIAAIMEDIERGLAAWVEMSRPAKVYDPAA